MFTIIAFDHLFVKLFDIFMIKGQTSFDHGVEDDTQRPDICNDRIVLGSNKDLRGGVAGRAAACFEL